MSIGRKILYTDVPEITYENVLDVVQKAFGTHQQNVADINYLLNFDMGEQSLQRKEPKKYRPDIDCVCIDNVAHEVVEFKLGFDWGISITSLKKSRKQGVSHTHKTIFTRILHELIHELDIAFSCFYKYMQEVSI